MIRLRARSGIIVNSDKPPIGISLDEFGIKLDLVLQTALLFLMARANSAVSRHPELLASDGCQSFILRYLDNISGHNKTSMLYYSCIHEQYNMEVSIKREATFQPRLSFIRLKCSSQLGAGNRT